MTPAEFQPPMEKALSDYGINPKMPRGKALIRGMWQKFRGYRAEPFAKALESACKKDPDRFPTPNKVGAAMDLIVVPPARKAAPEPEVPVENTREELEKSIPVFEAAGQQWLADMARRRLSGMA